MEKKDIKSMDLEELTQELLAMGEKIPRRTDLWLDACAPCAQHRRDDKYIAETAGAVKGKLCLYGGKAVRAADLRIDGTQKFLFRLADGNVVESVWMQYKHGNSVCISSQVGCRMGCRFCASTLDGLTRNLLPSEMLDQIYAITLLTGERVSNVVVMGTGEPFDNFDNLKKFIRLLTDENGLHISQRNVTVSTCGLVPRIYELAEENLQITLALSLHATTDEKRRKLMPIANKYSIDELMEACAYYHQKTGRRVTFEYSMVKGVNDSAEDAQQLTALAKTCRQSYQSDPSQSDQGT